MELDTGVTVSTMSLAQFKKLCPGIQIQSTLVKLRTCTGEIIHPVGTATVSISYKNQSKYGDLIVIRKKVDSIFGRDWLRLVKLDWDDIRQVKVLTHNYEEDLQKLLQEYSDVLSDELGEIPNCSYKFRLKNENVQPIFYKPRQVPYALIGKVEDEIARLERLGVIEQVTHSQWGTPVVPISKKDGLIRLCAAYNTTINNAIEDDCYPIPRIEDIFNKMSGGQFFCNLDINNAYLHMKLDDESALMQTLSTHKGVYKSKDSCLVSKQLQELGSVITGSIWSSLLLRRHRHSRKDQRRTIH
ncbi:hypothetical protein QE152_g35868 [Popillia japonica]|uniref:Reverse transcriptase domain-containing protein n=1 Tax=Popillia japonica TaxID=7064 RepID=A0AAW1IEZ4_POPJA